jgi:hypothetical protein
MSRLLAPCVEKVSPTTISSPATFWTIGTPMTLRKTEADWQISMSPRQRQRRPVHNLLHLVSRSTLRSCAVRKGEGEVEQVLLRVMLLDLGRRGGSKLDRLFDVVVFGL